MSTSLENILTKYNISKYRLIDSIYKIKNQRTFWGKKIIGKKCISVVELSLINDFLASQGITEKVEVVPDKFFIV